MKVYKRIISLLLTITFASVSFADEAVQFAAVIFRHGDRIPVDMYPTDPWRNESLWPVKFGELTNIGKMQHYALGQWLRKRYAHLLSQEFDPAEIYVRSTDVDRTLMSVQANLAGMYPPHGKSVWNNQLMWQPVPVHTVPEHLDEVLAMKKKCVAYDKEMAKLVHSKVYKERLSKYQSLMNYLTAYTGKKIKDYFDIEDIYSNLYIETLYNFTLPNWTHSVYPEKLREPACYSFTTSAATPLLARLRAGPLLEVIVSQMVKLVNNSTKELKVTVYSGHDFTVATFLNALGLFDGNCPVYTATILMELVFDNSSARNYVRISYRNSTEIVEPHILSIPYCGEKCPLERFIKLYESLLTVDFDKECGKKITGLLGISLFIGLGIFATIYVFYRINFAGVFSRNGVDVDYSVVHTTNPIKVISYV